MPVKTAYEYYRQGGMEAMMPNTERMEVLLKGHVNPVWEPAEEYATAIRGVESREALISTLCSWEPIAWDALDAAGELTEDAWRELQVGLKDRRKQRRTYAEKYGAILLPEIMLFVSFVAHQFHIPWGMTFNRLVETEKLQLVNKRWVRP
jgi:hypothetical protein